MKILRLNGIKQEIVTLDYNIIKEEKEQYERKNKVEKAKTYAKLLNNLKEESTEEEIENAVNKIIDTNKETIKALKKDIKSLEKEINLLSQISKREQEKDTIDAIIATF